MVSRDDLQRLSLDDDAPQGASELKAQLEGIWHPFETAPKDGTILVFEDAYGERRDVARWSRGEWSSVFGEMEDGVMARWRLAGI